MRPSATIQLTTMELVTGKPNGLAISTAFCEGPSSSCLVATAVGEAAATLADVAGEPFDSPFTAKAHTAPRHRNRTVRSSDVALFFNCPTPQNPSRFHSPTSALTYAFRSPIQRLRRCWRYCTLGRGS